MLIAQEIDGGYSYTLTTYALTFIEEAETLFGIRDSALLYGGVELSQNGNPQVWYPQIGGTYKHIVIQLTADALQSRQKAIYQLSHEVIHVLSPNGPQGSANNLDEGLAVWFSVKMTEKYASSHSYATTSLIGTPYFRPLQLVSELLN
jgi:hypothetical protein